MAPASAGAPATAPPAPPSAKAPPSDPPAPSSGEPPAHPPPTGRLIGVDLARGLAVFGMYAAHVGPDPATTGGVRGFLMELAHGRSSALFAFLAGFSVVLMTGRTPRTGRAGRRAVAKVVVRAVVLLALGTALTMTDTPVEVILAFYGLYFLLVLPLYRLSARTLAEIAVVAALVLPQLLFLIVRAVYEDGALGGGSTGPGAWPRTADGLVSLFFTGSYPALSWLPFVVAGMAVARLDLTAGAVRVRLALTGAGLAVLGYGGSWLALHHLPGVARALDGAGWHGTGTAWWSDVAGWPEEDTWGWLFVAAPHSETTLSVVANTGVALAVLAGCLLALDALPRLRRAAGPVIAVGSMSLTAYVFHIAAIRLLGLEELPGPSLRVLLGFVAGVTGFAVLWSRFFRRGPLEWLLWRATKVADRVP
ncbi:transporter [Streptomyces longispororuber]|uniref:Transporter n=1 Tax=Streptomyces longispororuber TaxID=68230 RepID=A0A919A7T3_9ACTN|nr:transporter [Streptomyces longispororuber]